MNELGWQKLQRGEYDKAISLFREAIALDSMNLAPRINIAGLSYKLGYYKDAIEVLEKCNQMRADEPKVLLNLGMAYHKAERTKEAFACFRHCRDDLNAWNSQTLLGIIHSGYLLGENEYSLEVANELLKSPEYEEFDEVVKFKKAQILFALGRVDKSIPLLHKVIKEYPKTPKPVHFNLFHQYYSINNIDSACKHKNLAEARGFKIDPSIDVSRCEQ